MLRCGKVTSTHIKFTLVIISFVSKEFGPVPAVAPFLSDVDNFPTGGYNLIKNLLALATPSPLFISDINLPIDVLTLPPGLCFVILGSPSTLTNDLSLGSPIRISILPIRLPALNIAISISYSSGVFQNNVGKVRSSIYVRGVLLHQHTTFLT